MLRVWCLGFALLLGCAQDLVLLCLVGCKALCEEVGASGLVFRVCCSCGLCPGLCVIVFLVAARFCVKRLVLRGLVFTQDLWCLGFALLLGCFQGWLLKV